MGALAKDEQQIKTGDMERARWGRKKPPASIPSGSEDGHRDSEGGL